VVKELFSERVNPPVKILTDIEIKQSPVWCEKTDYLGNLRRDGIFTEMIPSKLKNKIGYFLDLITIIKYRKKYDVVINASVKTGQLFSLFRRIFRIKKPKHIILELMLDEEKRALCWKIKKMIQRIAFPSVDLVFVSSKEETVTYSERFKMPKDRFRFLPFHTNVIKPQIMDRSDNYILSAGKTGRDYRTLADAVKGIKQKVIIVSDKPSVQDIKFPPNVEVLFDIPYQKYFGLLYRCSLVVVPLKKLLKSTGQVAILEAMAVGKPVIATETTGTVDYIESGVNGILVPVGDSDALNGAITQILADQSLYKKLSVNALEVVKQNHTFEIYVNRILEAAREIGETNR
jgi:glycosyltransferase involved in cell wall biosynthesis